MFCPDVTTGLETIAPISFARSSKSHSSLRLLVTATCYFFAGAIVTAAGVACYTATGTLELVCLEESNSSNKSSKSIWK